MNKKMNSSKNKILEVSGTPFKELVSDLLEVPSREDKPKREEKPKKKTKTKS